MPTAYAFHRQVCLVLAALALGVFTSSCASRRGNAPLDLGRDGRVEPSTDLGMDSGSRDAGNGDSGSFDLSQMDLSTGRDLGPDDLGTGDLGSSDLGSADLGRGDAGPMADGGAPGGYRHTITIDGVNDFDIAGEQIDTTTLGYLGYLSWDDDALYLGVDGEDVGSGSGTKWLLVFLDTNGPDSGASLGETYNTQAPSMPSGFSADYVFRWRADNSFESVQRWDESSAAWVDTSSAPATWQSGNFIETRIALADIAMPHTVGVASLMLNEGAGGEFAYAGLPRDTFTDGYYPLIPMTRWISADRDTSASPNAASRRRP